jgi:hypothetical protein
VRTRTVHIANDVHRILKQMAAHEEIPQKYWGEIPVEGQEQT